jgi:hypothetical protein
MPFTAFARGEKRLLIAALLLACLVGSLAGYAAYADGAEARFHGGVLDGDAAKAKAALLWETISAFARWGIGVFLVVGVVPIAVRRLLIGRGR